MNRRRTTRLQVFVRERTDHFLAWIRRALALPDGGLLLDQFSTRLRLSWAVLGIAGCQATSGTYPYSRPTIEKAVSPPRGKRSSTAKS
jgi:uncharacterized membrane protein YidH (DUF202 family)